MNLCPLWPSVWNYFSPPRIKYEMRGLSVAAFVCSAAVLLAGVSAGQTITAAFTSCPARATTVGGVPMSWHQGRANDTVELEQWCQAVGAPIFVQPPAPVDAPPPLEELAVVTWNAHLAEGRLADSPTGSAICAPAPSRPDAR